MRKFLATLMALVMLMSTIPVSAETTASGNTGAELKISDAKPRQTLAATAITTLKTTSKGLSIAWKAIEGAEKYQVFRSTKKASGFKRIATVTDTAYVDASAKRSNAYYYYIKAVGADGAVSQSATKGRYHDFGPAVKFSRDANGYVTISWAAKKNAVSYALYRADEGSSSYKKIATVKSGTSCVDKNAANGKTYSYYAVANYKVNGASIAGSQGSRKSYTYGVAQTGNLAAANVAGGAKLTWSAVEGATGYRVFYRANPSDAWTRLTTAKATAKSYTHTAPACGQLIQYAVRTQGKHNGKTVYAAYTIIDHVAVGQPTAEITVPREGDVAVQWTKAKGATGYEITLKADTGKVYTLDVSAQTGREALFSVTESCTYSATVRAYCDLEGKRWYGRVSSAVSTRAEGIDPATIPVMQWKLSDTPNMLDVSWQPVEGATGYIVCVDGEGWLLQEACAAGVSSISLPVNEGDMRVYMCAVFENGCGRECEQQAVTADWADGLALTAPAVTATKDETFNQVHFTWEAVTGADEYQLMLVQSDWDAAWTSAEPSLTATVNGNGTYTVNLRAEAKLPNGKTLVGPWYEADMTFAWPADVANMPVISAEVTHIPNLIKITWNAIRGAEKYIVQVYGGGNGWYIQEETTENHLSLSVNGGEQLQIYVCSVVDGAESDSAFTTLYAQWPDMVAMTQPGLTFTQLVKPKVRITWDAVEGATGYVLRVTAAGAGAGEYWVTGTSYTLGVTPEVAYQFNVMPLYRGADGVEFPGPRSAFVNCYPVWEDLPAPAAAMEPQGDHHLAVTWNELADVVAYDLYVNAEAATGNTSVYSGEELLAYIDVDGTYWTADDQEILPDEQGYLFIPNVTGPIDLWSNGGGTLRAYVAAHYADGAQVASEVVANKVTGDMLAATSITALAINEGFIDLNWTAVEGADGYVVVQIIGGVREDVLCAGDVLSASITIPEESWGDEARFYAFAYTDKSGVAGYPAEYWLEGVVTPCACVAEWNLELTAPVMTLSTAERGWLNIAWEPVLGATKYRIFYKASTATKYSNVYVEGGETSLRLPAANNTSYQVYMRAIRVGTETISGPVCSTKKVTTAWTTKLAAPTLTISRGEKGVLELSWTEVSGAAGYLLHYKKEGASAYTQIALDAQTLSYALSVAEETTYSLYVCAYEGDVSLPYVGKNKAAQSYLATWVVTLTAPVMDLVQETYFKLRVKWEPVDFANGYRIFYKEASATGFSNVIVDGDQAGYVLDVKNDTEYVVYMRAIHTAEDGTRTSGPICARQNVLVHWDAPEVPTPTLTITPVSGDQNTTEMEIAWTRADDSCGYVLYYRLLGEEAYASQEVTEQEQPELLFTAETGSVWEFYMQAYAMMGQEVIWGKATETVAVRAGYGFYSLVEPEMSLSLDARSNFLDVSWEQQALATHYAVYYKADTDSAYTRVQVDGEKDSLALEAEAMKTYSVYMTACFEDESGMREAPACQVQTIFAYWAPDMATPVLTLHNDINGKVTAVWSNITGANVTEVRYRKLTEEEYSYEGADLELVDTDRMLLLLEPETTYEIYLVTYHVYDGVVYGQRSSQAQTITTLGGPTILAPEMTVSLGDKYVVNLSWEAVENANGYSIFYKTEAQTGFTNVKVAGDVTSYAIEAEKDTTYEIYMRGIHMDEVAGVQTSGKKCANQTIWADWGTYRALVIGQTYPGDHNELPGPDVDAYGMKTMLATMAGSPYEVKVMMNLTSYGILSAIATTFADADEDSVSLFYYSGHGVDNGGGSLQGALCGVDGDTVSVYELRRALDRIPGTKIVLLDSCHSGEHIGKSVSTFSAVSKSAAENFNNAVIAAFAAKTRDNLATDSYYVITASRSVESSLSMGIPGGKYVGAFTHALLYGSGYDEWNEEKLAKLHADTNGDQRISLQEAYIYAYNGVLNGIKPLPGTTNQHVQVYPTDSLRTLWAK